MEKLLYWIWLSLCCKPISASFKKLMNAFPDAEAVYLANDSDLISCIGSRAREYPALISKDLKRASEILDFCRSKHVGIVTYADKEYPQQLRDIKAPPVLLYYRGIFPSFENITPISVVGARRNTQYGRKNAFEISNDLARAGATVVSGMATGVDGVALAGAISADMPVIAVIGSGIDVCYPKEHLTLARRIVRDGCVITEYAPGTKPRKPNFPKRNRIISALSYATVVIEGDSRSGAIITARHAKEQGRRVYALPGNVDNKMSEATNYLIKRGATLITSADDIVADFYENHIGCLNPFKLAELPSRDMYATLRELSVSCVAAGDDIFRPSARRFLQNKGVKGHKVSEPTDLGQPSANKAEPDLKKVGDIAAEIYRKIPLDDACTVDSLVGEGTDIRAVMKALLTLEMVGYVHTLPGERVKRA